MTQTPNLRIAGSLDESGKLYIWNDLSGNSKPIQVLDCCVVSGAEALKVKRTDWMLQMNDGFIFTLCSTGEMKVFMWNFNEQRYLEQSGFQEKSFLAVERDEDGEEFVPHVSSFMLGGHVLLLHPTGKEISVRSLQELSRTLRILKIPDYLFENDDNSRLVSWTEDDAAKLYLCTDTGVVCCWSFEI
eukprot:TRINITY_DN5379_c0_g1_i4.p2 TRINITY_DN5379_c0_g1~~TRINITY_DN5379_c0_g1_i4.p2  ORF type:complete len:187 (-),score=57.71 TRINITY_DN5379_c0_g1_i4:120-680(-)